MFKLPKIPYWYLLAIPWTAFGIGLFLNAIVMGVNAGQMPVQIFGGHVGLMNPADPVHTAMITTSHLKILGDWIVTPDNSLASPGDILIWTWELIKGPTFIAWVMLVIADYNKIPTS